MILALQWRRPNPPIVTRWRGPDGQLAQSALSASPTALAAIIGPPGLQGPPGDGNLAVIDGGIFT